MRATLLFKYVIAYLVLVICSLVVFNTYGKYKIEGAVIDGRIAMLNEEAEVIAESYLENYYRGKMPLSGITGQLRTIDNVANARIWIVSKDRLIIADTRAISNTQFVLTEDFLARSSTDYVQVDGLVEEPMISVVYPVYSNFSLSGYIVLLSSRAAIEDDCAYYIDTINSVFLLVSVVFLIVLSVLYIITIVPLKSAIATARQYADGHFDYKGRKSHRSDEFGDLTATIDYMASQLQKNEEYQHKLIANVSHDFRSPLTSIKGFTEAMLDGTIPPELYSKYLTTINFEVERLTKLTSGILDLSKYDNNSVILDVSEFDINRVIKQTAEVFEGICTKKKITLRLTFSESQSMVLADKGRIEQVIYNLLDNAVKFSSNDSNIDLSVTEKGSKYFISIKDYGRGIAKENIQKIWDRFYKIDTSRGKDKKGTGLGLSIVKEIISLHSENINVISTEGVGTEFVFTLQKAVGLDKPNEEA